MIFEWRQCLQGWLQEFFSAGDDGEVVASRNVKLKLDLPVLHVRSQYFLSQENKLGEPPESWQELGAHPIEQLREIDRYLQQLNSERISAKNRMAWVEHAMQYACPAMRKIYSEYYKTDALPEPHDRREGLVAAINVCGQLAMGYKRQLMMDFSLSDARYARVRTRVQKHALRVLELLRMEQRLRAMRYQKLPARAWRNCNRIFFALSQCEDVSIQYPGLNCLQLTLGHKGNDLERRAPSMVSINSVYLSIQINGLLDSNTISSRKMHLVDLHVAQIINSITVFPDHGKSLGRGKILIYPNQDCPAYFKRQDAKHLKLHQQWQNEHDENGADEVSLAEQLKAIIVDVAPLDAALMLEHKKLLERFESSIIMKDANKGQSKVTDQDDLMNLLTIDAMCDGLQLKQRKQQREPAVGQKILYVYNGFMSVYKLLVDMAAEDAEVPVVLGDEHDLRDALAGRSALIASDLESAESGQWFVVDKSEGGVHMKTRESQFTTALFIGQVVAFGFSREELKNPTLGYVLRLNRNLNKEIEVTIRILSQQAEATAVQSEFLSKNDMALPAIVLRGRAETELNTGDGDAGNTQLVLHHSHRLSPGTAIQIESSYQQQAYVIDELVKLQKEFIIYHLAVAVGPDAAAVSGDT